MSKKIIMAEFADDQYERARLQILDEDTNVVQNAELAVPNNFEKGKNKFWDMVLETYSIEELKEDRKQKIHNFREKKALDDQRRQGEIEAQELQQLFNLKSFYYNLPFVESEEDKSIIRKAPNKLCLEYTVYKMINDYVLKHNLEIEELFDIVEDSIFENLDEDE